MSDPKKDPTNALRQTGRTTRQLQALAHGGVFVWCNTVTQYPRRLANTLGRDDIRIISPDDLDRMLTVRVTAIKLDHATVLTRDQARVFEKIQERLAK